MSYPVELDGARLKAWAGHAAEELNRRRADINALNVFPVPDADTGSNMAHTMQAAVEQASTLDDDATAAKVAEALATGSVRGARGNSGVVLSQVLRGLAQSASHGPIGGDAIAQALTMAVELVDRAIADPVEGTVLTVLRAAATAATAATTGPDAAVTGPATIASADSASADSASADSASSVGDGKRSGSLVDVATAARDAARIALANTPSQLDVLREAGVVDAGGAGLVVLLETLHHEVTGEVSDGSSLSAEPERTKGELEVMFYFRGDISTLAEVLDPLGNSLVIARASETEATVHVHSADAGPLIEAAFAHGEVTDLRLEILPEGPRTTTPARAVLAVTPPGSLSELYEQAGATVVAPGANVVSDILATIRVSGAQEVVLLPNGLVSNRALVAVEKATSAFEQAIMLLPTVRLVSGIAALAVHDPDQPLATASYTMSEAAGEMRTAVVTRAERAALTQAGACAKGDMLAFSHGDIVAVGDTLEETAVACCRRLLESGGEQVTLLVHADHASALNDADLSAALGVDVVVYPADGLNVEAEIGVE